MHWGSVRSRYRNGLPSPETLVARGMDAAHGHQGAVAQLGLLVEQQARLIACEDLYRLVVVLALATAAFVLIQRRLN